MLIPPQPVALRCLTEPQALGSLNALVETLYGDGLVLCHDHEDGYFLGKIDQRDMEHARASGLLSVCAKNVHASLTAFVAQSKISSPPSSLLFGKLENYLMETGPIVIGNSGFMVHTSASLAENYTYEALDPNTDAQYNSLCQAIAAAEEYKRLSHQGYFHLQHFRP